MDVSIIIVNYNTKDLTKKCIESVIKYTTLIPQHYYKIFFLST